MFPDKIERMILDGVTDTVEYFHGNITAELLDTDKAVDTFFQSCFEAGPDLCAFYDSSPEKISANLDTLYEQLKITPMPANDGTNYGIFDYGLLRHTIRGLAYSPYQTFQPLAEGLALLAQGNASLMFSLGYTPLLNNPCSCGTSDPNINGLDALLTIACNDADAQNRTLEQWDEVYNAAANVSAYGEVLVGFGMRCQCVPFFTDRIRRFHPFLTDRGRLRRRTRSVDLGEVTQRLLFYLSATLQASFWLSFRSQCAYAPFSDPITPLVGAKRMSSLFPGSTTLTQNSTGVCALPVLSDIVV
jgi:hypothetical protein